MVAYEIHWLDEMGRDHLIGILPERRRKPERITLGSIFGWVRKYLPDKYNSISITPISFGKSGEEEFLPNHSFRAYEA
jgi:hypothetical protein